MLNPGTSWKIAFEEFAQQLRALIDQMDRLPGIEEARSRMRYRFRVEAERQKGLAAVRAKAAEVRRELGLPEN